MPSTLERKCLNSLMVSKLLPGTDCRDRGQPACLAFANKLVAGQRQLEQCLPWCRQASPRLYLSPR